METQLVTGNNFILFTVRLRLWGRCLVKYLDGLNILLKKGGFYASRN